jgi:uncharacterized protein YaaQ
MKFVRFPARLAGTPVRHRVAACSVAAAAVLGGTAFAATPASAATPMCLDANTQQAYNFGAVMQWQCDDSKNSENWTITDLGSADGGFLVSIKNNATGLCVDADAQQVYDFGSIIQWQCNTSDPFQMWILKATSEGVTFENYGPYLQGVNDCLDADAQQVNDNGGIIQWACNASDPYQNWVGQTSDNDVLQNVGA